MRRKTLLCAVLATAILPILAAHAAPEAQTGPTAPGPAIYLPVVKRDPPQGPVVGNCPMFPADHIWNARVDSLPVHASSATWVTSIGAGSRLKADFGSGLFDGFPIGIP